MVANLVMYSLGIEVSLNSELECLPKLSYMYMHLVIGEICMYTMNTQSSSWNIIILYTMCMLCNSYNCTLLFI